MAPVSQELEPPANPGRFSCTIALDDNDELLPVLDRGFVLIGHGVGGKRGRRQTSDYSGSEAYLESAAEGSAAPRDPGDAARFRFPVGWNRVGTRPAEARLRREPREDHR